MSQAAIPFLFMRGGSSRGPYFDRAVLPEDRDALAAVLIRVVGSGHPLNIDGIGGGNAVTTKVVMLSPSTRDDADIDYFFAQVSVTEQRVDFGPTCGNMLTGVGPAALELGMIAAQGDETLVRIHAVNIGARIDALVQTPGGAVRYDGETRIDGVPGSAAPVLLRFLDVAGGICGSLLPTGNRIEQIDGIDVTCMDVAMPIMIARAADFGLGGHETVEALNENSAFLARAEAMRLQAGERMGLGDVRDKVMPKIALLAPAAGDAVMAVRYFMPKTCHPTLAVTGAQCLAACALTPGTVAAGIARPVDGSPVDIRLEHPMGSIDVNVDYRLDGDEFRLLSAGLTRTARLIARGDVMVPSALMPTP